MSTLRRLVPGLLVLRGYRRAWLLPDLMAGLTVGAMLVPQAMAYAELAGLPPETGFFAAMLPLLVYTIVGSSRHLGVGPEPGTAILAAAGVGLVAQGDPARYAALMAALALVVAVVALVAAALRLGFLAELLSKPVLVGYITGVGLTLLSSQLGKALGVPMSADGFFGRIVEVAPALGALHLPTASVFAGTLATLLILKRFAKRVPAALVAVTLATVVTALADLDAHGVKVLGAIESPHGVLPPLGLPSVSLADVAALIPTALGVALVGYTDNVLTARSVAAKHGYRIDANQELFALGMTNLASGLSHAFPISSSASRTAVPSSLGSHTQLVGLVALAFVAATLGLLAPALAAMPAAALAAVIVAAALAIIDLPGYRRLARVSRAELALAIVAALGVMIFDVLVGVLVAIVASVVLALARIARPHDAVLAASEGLDGWVDADQHGLAPTHPGLIVYRFDAPLFFANINHFRERLAHMLTKNPGEETWVVLDFEGIGEVDATALDGLGELVDELVARHMTLAVARANPVVVARLSRGGLLAPAGPVQSHATIKSAVRAFREHQESMAGAQSRGAREP
ncbi:MAG: sulfate permease [Deltaproteobacteria bacterium]|nr:sulfate permease [Deltaproteobacteria bacterium]